MVVPVGVLHIALSVTPLNEILEHDPLKLTPLEANRQLKDNRYQVFLRGELSVGVADARVEPNGGGLGANTARLLASSSQIVVAGVEADPGAGGGKVGSRRTSLGGSGECAGSGSHSEDGEEDRGEEGVHCEGALKYSSKWFLVSSFRRDLPYIPQVPTIQEVQLEGETSFGEPVAPRLRTVGDDYHFLVNKFGEYMLRSRIMLYLQHRPPQVGVPRSSLSVVLHKSTSKFSCLVPLKPTSGGGKLQWSYASQPMELYIRE
jgi:hypothetical protein